MGFIQVPPDSTGKLIDTSSVNSTGGGTAQRHNVVIGDPVSTGGLAPVTSSGGLLVTTLTSGPYLTNNLRGVVPASIAISATTSGNSTLVVADATNKIKVISYLIVADSSNTVNFASSVSSLSGSILLSTAGTGVAISGSVDGWVLETTGINNALVLSLGNAGGIRGHLSYFKEP